MNYYYIIEVSLPNEDCIRSLNSTFRTPEEAKNMINRVAHDFKKYNKEKIVLCIRKIGKYDFNEVVETYEF